MVSVKGKGKLTEIYQLNVHLPLFRGQVKDLPDIETTSILRTLKTWTEETKEKKKIPTYPSTVKFDNKALELIRLPRIFNLLRLLSNLIN